MTSINSFSFYFKSAGLPDLDEIRKFVITNAAEMGARPDAVDELVLAVNEAITNILVHGYHNKPGNIDLDVERQGPDLVVRLRDHATLYDPTQVPPPDVTLPLDQRSPGGLGIHMMRQFTDELRYRVTPNGENELLLFKYAALPEDVTPAAAESPITEEDRDVN